MGTLINRCEVKQRLLKHTNFQAGDSLCDYSITLDELYSLLDSTPTVEQPQGEWELIQGSSVVHSCSCCNARIIAMIPYNYCPNCGAKMRGEENEND